MSTIPETAAIRDVIAELTDKRAKWGDNHSIPSTGRGDPGHDGSDGDLARGAVYLATEKPARGWYDEWMVDLRSAVRGNLRRRLVIAAALLIAELERLDRSGS